MNCNFEYLELMYIEKALETYRDLIHDSYDVKRCNKIINKIQKIKGMEV